MGHCRSLYRSLWVVVSHFGSLCGFCGLLWILVGRCGSLCRSLWIIMGGCRSLWIVVSGCRSLWIVVGGCRLLWVIPYFSMYELYCRKLVLRKLALKV